MYRRLPSLRYRRFPNRQGVTRPEHAGNADGPQAGRPATQQTGKSAGLVRSVAPTFNRNAEHPLGAVLRWEVHAEPVLGAPVHDKGHYEPLKAAGRVGAQEIFRHSPTHPAGGGSAWNASLWRR